MSDQENGDQFFAGIKPKSRYGKSLPVTRVPANMRVRPPHQERLNSAVDAADYAILKGLAILYEESIKWVITVMVRNLPEQVKQDATETFQKAFPNRE
jgi:hypothetical protein